LLCSSPPKTAPNEGIGIKDRGLVCTILGLCGRGSGATRGLRALVLVLQRGECGGRLWRSALYVGVYSSFLDGKDGLGGIKALFSVGLSASCIVHGSVVCAVTVGACLELCNGTTGCGACRLASARLFTVCMEGEGMHMEVYRSRCLRTVRCDQAARPAAQSDRAREGRGDARRRGTQGRRTYRSDASSEEGRPLVVIWLGGYQILD
jgi:hypothetical protein